MQLVQKSAFSVNNRDRTAACGFLGVRFLRRGVGLVIDLRQPISGDAEHIRTGCFAQAAGNAAAAVDRDLPKQTLLSRTQYAQKGAAL